MHQRKLALFVIKSAVDNLRRSTYVSTLWLILFFHHTVTFADGVEYHDPSDMTNLVTSLSPVLEYHRYENQNLPDDGLWELKLEGQYSKGSVMLLGDVGYGYRTGTRKSGLTDSRIRFFHVPYRNDEESAWISDFGWSIDSNLPIGDVDDGLGSGNWVFAPGIIWTHELNKLNIAPNLVYQFTWANSDLGHLIPSDGPDESRAFRIELNLSVVTQPRYWFMLTPSYTWGIENTDDGGYIKIFTGMNINSSHSLGFDAQWNFDVRNGLLQEDVRGEQYKIRLQWEMYF